MKPFIGVTPSCDETQILLQRTYVDAIQQSGGLPMILPFTDESEDIVRCVQAIDGLLLTGGADVDPAYYEEEPLPALGRVSPQRDRLEIALTVEAMRQHKPILAICRGAQVLNVAMGGSLYQDIPSQCNTSGRVLLQHRQAAPKDHPSHQVKVMKGTLLERIAGTTVIKTNSFHHQSIKVVAPGFDISAATSDAIVEAIEHMDHAFVLGVQWHPEGTFAVDSVSRELFRQFVAACGQEQSVG